MLKTAERLEIDGAILYPCPVHAGDSKEDPTAWIDANRSKIAIGIAHGSVENAVKTVHELGALAWYFITGKSS